MHLYRLSLNATRAAGMTPDDVLAPVVQAVDALTIVHAASAVPVSADIVSVRVDYWGLNVHEAGRTAAEGATSLGTVATGVDSVTTAAL